MTPYSQNPQNREFPDAETSKKWRILSLTRLRADPVGRQSRTGQRSLSFRLPDLGNSISARHIPLPQINPTKSPDPGVEGNRDLVPLWNFRKKELGCPRAKGKSLHAPIHCRLCHPNRNLMVPSKLTRWYIYIFYIFYSELRIYVRNIPLDHKRPSLHLDLIQYKFNTP